MTFTRKAADLVPIEDTVFAVVDLANKEAKKIGPENVVNATIGALYDENGELVAYKSVFDHYNQISNKAKAKYAASFVGNDSYRQQVYQWVTQGANLDLAHRVIATPGGSGAVSMTFANILDANETVILPNIAWGSYKLMATQNNFKVQTYSLFEEDHFNLDSFKAVCSEVLNQQKKLLIVINDPCHNPTGYSMTRSEWDQVIEFLNKCSEIGPVVLIDDIAYIDYAYDIPQSRKVMEAFNHISDNVLISIAFSCSKTCTSYGLRCGAAIILAKKEESVREVEIVFEKHARAVWSNIPNAAMDNFTWVTTDNYFNFLSEKQDYIDLLKQRSSIFMEEANKVGLDVYPYKEGFFVTVKCKDNNQRDQLHEKLIKHHIFTVKVNLGIRVAICSCSIEKTKGLATAIKMLAD
ncbi:pyridoxal phosphate-dependent aminotransferase [Anaerorhabdus furcosa]|uniref:Aromatic-amino-acid transaminase n=1 Tax=Anaerorhabdus furcosa TaxID=118967 RepID=A0A1T4JWG4_9FIRM|nr:aminotransferase class I/II-fold pyridoxal phosphate-dependent enzyme [Anaerorhabdus furcosa]SJZ34540.1 aromatic-amino-acid transaminase [Anaerorhabdus furcosa]